MDNCCVGELVILCLEAGQNSLAAKAILKCSENYLASTGASTATSV